MLGGGVDHDRDAARLDDRRDFLEPQAAHMLLLAEQHHHRHGLGERRVEIFARVDLDEMAADHSHRLVISETLGPRNEYPIDHPVGKRQAQHLDRVVAGNAGRRPQCNRRGTAAGNDAPFGAGQLGKPLPRRLHQFVEIDKMARRLGDRLTDLRQHQAAAMHRAHAAAIDERPHAEHQIGIGVGFHGIPGIDQPEL